MCSSCGVRSLLVADGPLADVSPVASSSLRARSANASAPIASNEEWAARELCSRVDASVLASEPFAVEEMASGEVGP